MKHVLTTLNSRKWHIAVILLLLSGMIVYVLSRNDSLTIAEPMVIQQFHFNPETGVPLNGEVACQSGGRILSSGTYQEGKRTGLHREYDPATGGLVLEANYKDGLLDGTRSRYNGSGNLVEQQQFVAGLPDGQRTILHTDGTVSREFYKQGAPAGEWIQYDSSDVPIRTISYSNAYTEAQQYLLKHDLHKAFPQMKAAFEAGDSHAQCELGIMYLQGLGCEVDLEKGLQLLRSCEESADVLMALGFYSLSYFAGKDQNYEKAFQFFQRAADRKNPAAMVQLGKMLMRGTGCTKNPEAAFQYYRDAAKAGFAPGVKQEAFCYWKGIGVPVDKEKAIRLLQSLRENEDREVHRALYELYGETGRRKLAEQYWKAMKTVDDNTRRGMILGGSNARDRKWPIW